MEARAMALMTQGVQALKLTDVWKSFDGVDALKGVTFEARAGEVHALLGENGAGKSTLMAIAAGSLVPDRGSMELKGEPVQASSPLLVRQRGLSIAYQHPALIPDLTVYENLAMWLPAQAREARGAAWALARLQRVGCTAGLGQRVASLSVVQRQLLEIAKSLAADPAVLILDEPTASLGAEETKTLFAELRRLAASGVAVVYITHRLAEVRELCQQVTVLRDGAVRGTFGVDEVTDEQLLELIVGREVTTEFPPKASTAQTSTGQTRGAVLNVERFSNRAFHDVSLSVRGGEIVGLAGIVGNGQSEFLRAIAGLGHATGSAELLGTRLKPARPKASLKAGAVYLSPDRLHEGLFGTLSVRENSVVSSLRQFSRSGVTNRRAESRAVEAERGSLSIKAASIDANVLSLSGGNQQKVLLARTLLNKNASLLLADEPTRGVDVGARAEIYRILRQVAESGAGVLVVSSDIRELAGLCDRVIVFSSGQVVAELGGAEVREDAIAHAMLTSTTRRRADAGHRPELTRPEGLAGRARAWLSRLSRGDNAPPVVLAIAIIAIAVYTQAHNARFLSTFNLSTLTVLIAALAFIALGQECVILTGGIDLSVGPLAGLMVVIGSFFENAGKGAVQVIIGFVIMAVVAAVVGLVNGSLVHFAKFTPIVATLVSYTAIQGVSLVLRPFQAGYISFTIINEITRAIGPIAIAFIVAVVAAVGMERALHRARWGRSLRAIGSDAAAAFRLGVRPPATVLGAYVLSALLAFVGGVLLMSQVGVGDPTQGVSYTLASVTAVVLGGTSISGGRGSFIGALFGAVLVEQLLNVTTFLQLSQAWQYWFEGVLVMVAVGLYSQVRGGKGARGGQGARGGLRLPGLLRNR
ncbi:MAG TPA: ATP-binding cassette domain-containing protein [Streptosporangiaceae bacterium]|nr:ATP-binding cassette domain-containing protein [Streptosporangiaceae bacterium]